MAYRMKSVRWRIGFASVIVIAVVLVIAAITIGPRLRSPEQAAADAAPPKASKITVPVEKRVLAEPIVVRGKVLPGASIPVLPPQAVVGTGSVVTKVVVKAGQVLKEGQVVIERSGSPMIALVLPFPLYRDLSEGLSGPDVKELQQALRRLGYSAPTSGTFDVATRQALERHYRARGYAPPVAAGGQPKPVGGAGDAGADAEAARGKTGAVTLAKADVIRIDRDGRAISSVLIAVGDVLAEATKPLMELDSGAPYVAVTVSAQQLGLVSQGKAVTINDESTGVRAQGTIATIATKAELDQATGVHGFAVTVAFTGEAMTPAKDRMVRVDIAVASTREAVLAVPLTAVYSRPDGSTFVTTVGADGAVADVTVTVGQNAGGWAQVTPGDAAKLPEGTAVLVGATGRK